MYLWLEFSVPLCPIRPGLTKDSEPITGLHYMTSLVFPKSTWNLCFTLQHTFNASFINEMLEPLKETAVSLRCLRPNTCDTGSKMTLLSQFTTKNCTWRLNHRARWSEMRWTLRTPTWRLSQKIGYVKSQTKTCTTTCWPTKASLRPELTPCPLLHVTQRNPSLDWWLFGHPGTNGAPLSSSERPDVTRTPS